MNKKRGRREEGMNNIDRDEWKNYFMNLLEGKEEEGRRKREEEQKEEIERRNKEIFEE